MNLARDRHQASKMQKLMKAKETAESIFDEELPIIEGTDYIFKIKTEEQGKVIMPEALFKDEGSSLTNPLAPFVTLASHSQ